MITNAEKNYLRQFFSFQLSPGNTADPSIGNIWASHLYNAVVNAIAGNNQAAQSFMNQANQFTAQHAQAFSFIPAYKQQLEIVAREIVKTKRSPDVLNRLSCAEGNCPMTRFVKPKQKIAEELKKIKAAAAAKAKAKAEAEAKAKAAAQAAAAQAAAQAAAAQAPGVPQAAPIPARPAPQAPQQPAAPVPPAQPSIPPVQRAAPVPGVSLPATIPAAPQGVNYLGIALSFAILGGLGYGLYKISAYLFGSKKTEKISPE